MSRSIHITLKALIKGKSKTEVGEMFDPISLDPDAGQWVEKSIIKQEIRNHRKAEKTSKKKSDEA